MEGMHRARAVDSAFSFGAKSDSAHLTLAASSPRIWQNSTTTPSMTSRGHFSVRTLCGLSNVSSFWTMPLMHLTSSVVTLAASAETLLRSSSVLSDLVSSFARDARASFSSWRPIG